ncbi:von Willebrand factor-like [Pristis pectinata]|uniref:von Willebrand factor-like n=1 Tax=Pristis pectinata TaxID=685728 RepID=UPI00223D30AE|nr:von Willebrand factor-like [Pristis pectinata]
MPFDEQGCKSGGGEKVRVDSSCCFTCKYKSEQCKKVTRLIKGLSRMTVQLKGMLTYIIVRGTVQVDTPTPCRRMRLKGNAPVARATASAPVVVPLRCPNGTVCYNTQ